MQTVIDVLQKKRKVEYSELWRCEKPDMLVCASATVHSRLSFTVVQEHLNLGHFCSLIFLYWDNAIYCDHFNPQKIVKDYDSREKKKKIYLLGSLSTSLLTM